jgi:hypothetical protein
VYRVCIRLVVVGVGRGGRGECIRFYISLATQGCVCIVGGLYKVLVGAW